MIDVTTAVVDGKTPITRRRIVSNQQGRESDAKGCSAVYVVAASRWVCNTKKTKVRQLPVYRKEGGAIEDSFNREGDNRGRD
jgi:hypothetical protein